MAVIKIMEAMRNLSSGTKVTVSGSQSQRVAEAGPQPTQDSKSKFSTFLFTISLL